MIHQWLQHSKTASHVIVVFGGWAIGSAVFAHLKTGSDILFVSDYQTLDNALPALDHYQSRSLVAWSFGVASYAYWQQAQPDDFNRKIALNGSLMPINRLQGIPPKIMQKTIDGLSHDSFQKFLTLCHGTEQAIHQIDVAQRKAELIAIQTRDYSGLEQNWDKVWLSANDRIFPFANMQRAWRQPFTVQNAPHVPFAKWVTWGEVLA